MQSSANPPRIAADSGLIRSVKAEKTDPGPATLRVVIDGVPFRPFFETYGRYSVYQHVTLK